MQGSATVVCVGNLALTRKFRVEQRWRHSVRFGGLADFLRTTRGLSLQALPSCPARTFTGPATSTINSRTAHVRAYPAGARHWGVRRGSDRDRPCGDGVTAAGGAQGRVAGLHPIGPGPLCADRLQPLLGAPGGDRTRSRSWFHPSRPSWVVQDCPWSPARLGQRSSYVVQRVATPIAVAASA